MNIIDELEYLNQNQRICRNCNRWVKASEATTISVWNVCNRCLPSTKAGQSLMRNRFTLETETLRDEYLSRLNKRTVANG